MRAVINPENCMHDPEMCMAIPVCPSGALHFEGVMGGEGHMAIDEDLCSGCGACADECCGDAIVMDDAPAAAAAAD